MSEEAETLDEYAGMSVVDIAHAVVNWPEGSEDQQRAIAAIQARRPGIGHNRPPLAEQLAEEIAPFTAAAGELIEVAGTAVIIDDISAAKIVDLAGKIRALEDQLTARRAELKKPYQDAIKLIDTTFVSVITPLAVARVGTDGKGGLRGMQTAYENKRAAEAEALRRRLADEQRKREEEAAAARRAAEEQAAAGKSTVKQDLAALAAEDQAEVLERQAKAIRPAPTRGQLGQVAMTRSITFRITDLGAAVRWMLKQPLKAGLEQSVRTIMGTYLRGLGVDAVERGVMIPGVEAGIEKQASNRR